MCKLELPWWLFGGTCNGEIAVQPAFFFLLSFSRLRQSSACSALVHGAMLASHDVPLRQQQPQCLVESSFFIRGAIVGCTHISSMSSPLFQSKCLAYE